jgi:RNA polymerase sigma factor (sigma-70 family)
VEKRKLQIVASQSSRADWTPEVDEVWGLLADLSGRQRMALVLRFYEDLTVPAIAEVMGVRPGTVKSLIHRGLAQLKERIEP